MLWQCADYTLDLAVPKIMAVINVTADSFSDGGEFLNVSEACRQIDAVLEAGADILDLGAESTRPGAVHVPEHIEWARLEPILNYAVKLKVPVSVDTYKPSVMQRAIDRGAAIINDVQALNQPGALECVAASKVGVCLMHIQGSPQTMQYAPQYDNVVDEVSAFLKHRFQACHNAGIAAARVVLDPGIGFGKTLTHNLDLLRGIKTIQALGCPVLIGVSRKSMIGSLTGQEIPKDRLAGSLAAAIFAIHEGARILRVHDVRATKDALAVWMALSL